MTDDLTYDVQLAEMYDLNMAVSKAQREADEADQRLRRAKRELASVKAKAQRRFLTMLAAGDDLPTGVSKTTTKFYEYDADAMLEAALAEGIDEVIRQRPPELNRARFREMLKDGLELDGVTKGERLSVTISKAAMTEAWAKREFARREEERAKAGLAI